MWKAHCNQTRYCCCGEMCICSRHGGEGPPSGSAWPPDERWETPPAVGAEPQVWGSGPARAAVEPGNVLCWFFSCSLGGKPSFGEEGGRAEPDLRSPPVFLGSQGHPLGQNQPLAFSSAVHETTSVKANRSRGDVIYGRLISCCFVSPEPVHVTRLQ